MARQTRAERRARREAAAPQVATGGAGAGDGRGKPPTAELPGAPHHRGSFIRESIGELRKVEWPGQNQVIQGTVVVLIACTIIGTYLYFADQVFRRFVENILLGQ
jgi:preprotein translocase SecE subunit